MLVVVLPVFRHVLLSVIHPVIQPTNRAAVPLEAMFAVPFIEARIQHHSSDLCIKHFYNSFKPILQRHICKEMLPA
jgi:hypothetical protein